MRREKADDAVVDREVPYSDIGDGLSKRSGMRGVAPDAARGSGWADCWASLAAIRVRPPSAPTLSTASANAVMKALPSRAGGAKSAERQEAAETAGPPAISSGNAAPAPSPIDGDQAYGMPGLLCPTSMM